MKKQEEAEAEKKESSIWDVVSEAGHFGLDIVGLFPGAGDLADLANCAWYGAEGDAVDAALSCAAAVPGAGYGATAAKYGKKAEKFFKAAAKGGKEVAIACKRNSFTPETPVMMAGGGSRPIKDVRIGDKVLATDPETGRNAARTVDDVIVGSGVKHLVRLTVDTDGDQGAATGEVTATDGHPFWLVDRQEWVKAGDITPGALLRTPDGATNKVEAVRTWTAEQQVFNLTVADLHTYYVRVGAAAVLVHNSNPCKEIVLGQFDHFEQARNEALKLLGPIDEASRKTLIGRLESATSTYGKPVGFTTKVNGVFKQFRLDIDEAKGLHINVMVGKGASARKWAVPWKSKATDFKDMEKELEQFLKNNT